MTQTETVVLRLQNAVSGPAAESGGALARLERAIVRDQNALARLDKQMLASKGRLIGMTDATKRAATQDRIARMSDARGALQDKIGGVREKLAGGSLTAPKLESGGKLSEFFNTLKGRIGLANGQLAGSISTFAKFGAIAVAVAASIVLVKAALESLYAIVKRAVVATEGYREEWLALRQAVAQSNFQFHQIAGTVTRANEAQAAVLEVAGRSAQAQDKIAGFAAQLIGARVAGSQLTDTLQTMAMVADGGGEAMAQRYLEQVRMARLYGLNLKDLNARYEKTFGPVAKARLLSLSVQFQNFGKNLKWLFSGTERDIEPFLRGLQAILSLFGKNSSSARGFKGIIQAVTEEAIYRFLQFENALLRGYIWLQQHKEAWGAIKIVFKAAAIAVGVLAAAIIVAAVGIAAAITLAFLPLMILPLAVLALIHYWDALKAAGASAAQAVSNAWNGVVAWFRGLDFASLGAALVQGIAAGILAAGGAILEALKTAIGSAWTGVKGAFGIHSPSRVMALTVGLPMAQGVAAGIRSGRAGVAASAKETAFAAPQAMARETESFGRVPPPAINVTPPPRAERPAATPGKSTTLTFTGCSFGGDLNESKLRMMLHGILEGEMRNAEAAA
jgi:hypothetical protein